MTAGPKFLHSYVRGRLVLSSGIIGMLIPPLKHLDWLIFDDDKYYLVRILSSQWIISLVINFETFKISRKTFYWKRKVSISDFSVELHS